jgi:hypothetical protein
MSISYKLPALIVLLLHLSLHGYSFQSAGRAGEESALSGESVYVHFDRDIYIAGESLLYSVYLTDKSQGGFSVISKVVYLEVLNRDGTAVARRRVAVENGVAGGMMLLPDTIDSGNYILRSYTAAMRDHGSEGFFSAGFIVYNPFADVSTGTRSDSLEMGMREAAGYDRLGLKESSGKNLTVSMEEKFSTRQKVVCNIKLDSAAFALAEGTRLSISVSKRVNQHGNRNITETIEAGDRVPVNDMMAGKDSLYHYAEALGPYLNGTVISRETNLPVAGVLLYLSQPGKIPLFQYSRSGSNGDFQFLLPPLEGAKDLIIQASDMSDNIMVKIKSPFYDGSTTLILAGSVPDKNLIKEMVRMGVNYQIGKIFSEHTPAAEEIISTVPPMLRFYGKPDKEVLMADYIALPTMEEVFHELVPGVSLRRQKETYNFIMTNELTGESMGTPDLVLLDGVILKDHSVIAMIDPDLIERIDIVRGAYQAGNQIINGIISLISKSGDLWRSVSEISGLRTSYHILDQNSEQRNVVYGEGRSVGSRIPDFRNTLYWRWGIIPDKSGTITVEFFTSDYESDYHVVIEGLTDKGVPLSYTKKIVVSVN